MRKILVLIVLGLAAAAAQAQTSVPGWPSTGGGGSSAGSGTGSSTAQPSYLVTASPYNAKCDGSTDDTTAIQNAITAASAAHGTVIFPAGTCNISSPLAIAAGTVNLSFMGQGWASTGISQTTTNADGIDFNCTGGSPCSGLQFHDFFLTRPAGFTGTPRGLSINNCNNCKFDWVQIFNYSTNFYITGGANNFWTHLTSVASGTTVANGYVIAGQTNSLMVNYAEAIGAHTIGMSFTTNALDTFVFQYQTAASVVTGISINAIGVSDVHFINPILDSCGGNCINVTNSTTGGLGNSNNISIVDCFCNTANVVASPVLISGSEGVHILGGTFTAGNTSAAVGVIQAVSNSTRISVVGAKITNPTSGSTGSNVAINFDQTTDSTITGNMISAPSSDTFSQGIALTTTSTGNTVTGNVISGYGTTGINLGTGSTNNVLSGNNIDLTHYTTAITDAAGGNSYSSSTLASGIFGDAFSYKATSAITGPIPVKWDTGNANQVVTTATTDTGAGVPVGVCANSPGAGAACLVMTHGTAALKFGTNGTGNCSIGNFVIVDTTTNGSVKCTGTYSAGTVIGTAQAAQSTTATPFNVMIGLR